MSDYRLRVYVTDEKDTFRERLHSVNNIIEWCEGETAIIKVTHGEEVLEIKVNHAGYASFTRRFK
jgi:hypothetical protein